MVTGYIVFFAAFFMKPDPTFAFLDKIVADFHSNDCSHTSKAVSHCPDDSTVAQPKEVWDTVSTPPFLTTFTVGMLSRSARASSAVKTGVLPLRTTCFGPRTASAGLISIT